MKILVCEYFTAKGHANLFVNVCKLLEKSGFEVIAVVPRNFTNDLSFCKVEKLKLKYYTDEYTRKRSIVTKTVYSFHTQKLIYKLYKKYDIEATFVVTFDEIALALGKFAGFIKEPTFIIHNLNPDDIHIIKYRRFAFNLIKNKVYSVVLAGYIKDFLVSTLQANPQKVLVLPHPMNQVFDMIEPDIDCVGISNSNDETIIEDIINIEKKFGLLRKNNVKVLLKSRIHNYDNGYLKIISGFIDSSLYDSYIARAKCIFIPFPTSFKYRVSGTLIDALSNNKSVIGTNINVINNALNRYSNVIKLFDKTSFIKDVIESGNINQLKKEDFNNFQIKHSEEMLSRILSNAIINAKENRAMEDIYDF